MFSPSDVAGYQFANLQQAWRLHNGNTVINNWVNEWNKSPGNKPATTIQFLDFPSAPENVHFGPIQ
jgi:hypothetical protein